MTAPLRERLAVLKQRYGALKFLKNARQIQVDLWWCIEQLEAAAALEARAPEPQDCRCGHLKGRHQITNLGNVTRCSDCGCERFEARAPEEACPSQTLSGPCTCPDAKHVTGASRATPPEEEQRPSHRSKWCLDGKDAESHSWCANRSSDESRCTCPCHRLRPRNYDTIVAWLAGASRATVFDASAWDPSAIPDQAPQIDRATPSVCTCQIVSRIGSTGKGLDPQGCPIHGDAGSVLANKSISRATPPEPPAPRKLKAITAQCNNCGSYTDNITVEWEPPMPCACGSSDASWHGDTLRIYCCDTCWARSVTPEPPAPRILGVDWGSGESFTACERDFTAIAEQLADKPVLRKQAIYRALLRVQREERARCAGIALAVEHSNPWTLRDRIVEAIMDAALSAPPAPQEPQGQPEEKR